MSLPKLLFVSAALSMPMASEWAQPATYPVKLARMLGIVAELVASPGSGDFAAMLKKQADEFSLLVKQGGLN